MANVGKNRAFSWRSFAINALLFCLAILILFFCFKNVDWEEFTRAIVECNWWWVILAMIVGWIGFVIRAVRWNLLLKEINPNATPLGAYSGVTIGNLANFALPRVGEIVRCTVVSSYDKTPFSGAVGSVVVERVWDLIILILLLLSIFLFNSTFADFIKSALFGGENHSIKLLIYAGIAIVVALLILIVALFFIGKSSKQSKEPRGKLLAFIYKFISKFKDGIVSIFRMPNKWLFFLLTILLWASFWMTSKCTLMAFDALSTFTYQDALFLMIVGSLGWAVPVQGGIGAYHFILSLALVQVYGLTQSQGMVFATISHESQAIIMIIAGLVSMVIFKLSKRGDSSDTSPAQKE